MLHLGERSYGRPRHRGPRRDVKSSLDGHPFLLLSQCAKLGCGTAYIDAMTTAEFPTTCNLRMAGDFPRNSLMSIHPSAIDA